MFLVKSLENIQISNKNEWVRWRHTHKGVKFSQKEEKKK